MIGDFVKIGKNIKIWHPEFVNIYGQAEFQCVIGDGVNIGSFVEIGPGVKIGNNVSIGAFSFIPGGVTIEDDCFIGPRATFTNDKYPPTHRANWQPIIVRKGAKIGAGAIILPGVEIGENALIGAGSVVTKNVEANTIVKGNPAQKSMELNELAEELDTITKKLLFHINNWGIVGFPPGKEHR